jgi:predicted glycosyltransferase
LLEPERLAPRALARELERLLEFEPARPRLDLEGARRSTELVWELAAPATATSVA